MKTLIYTGSLGPKTVTFGVAGPFEAGVPKLIEDDAIAAQLLGKGCFEEASAPKKAAAAAKEE